MQPLIQAWLESQCGQISGVAGGVVMLLPRGGGSALAPAAAWPSGGPVGQELESAAKAAYERQQPLTQGRLNGAERPIPVGPVISYPIQVKGKTVGAWAVLLNSDVTLPPHAAVSGVQRGAESFEEFMRHNLVPGKAGSANSAATQSFAPAPAATAAQQPKGSASSTSGGAPATSPASSRREDPDKTQELPAPNSVRILHLLATIEAHDGFKAAATAFATELAEMFDCDRVSVGLLGRRHIKVEALSHSTEFKSNQGLLRDIGAAMEEGIWQGATLMFPQPEGAQPRVDRLHATLAQRHGSLSIYTVPLVKSGKPVGAVTLERNRSDPLPRAEITLCENVAALLGPLLETKRAVDRAWPMKIALALREAAAPLLGPGHKVAKTVAATLLVVLVSAALIPGDYRVSAPARLEGAVQRVLVAPADGYLKQAHVRPGDLVKSGQLLAELADEDLKLEQRRAMSDVAQLENTFGAALMKQDRAEVAIQYAKLEEAKAKLALVDQQLQRVKLVAPFDGVLITGDLTQMLGAPVKKGDQLLTLAPEHDFRVIVEVDERDIGNVHIAQEGHLALAALPGDALPFEVSRITPVATVGQGRNFFEVEARLKANGQALRPGLAGVAKVDAGTRSLLWIWTHRLYDWMRLTAWSWIG
jgi:multidrug efflux pump subunit AcrA (membrane-fusion protein)